MMKPLSRPRAIIAKTCEIFGVHSTELLSPSREHHLHRARSAAAYVMNSPGTMSLTQIARAFNRSDHTTARYMLDTARNLLATDEDFMWCIHTIQERMGECKLPITDFDIVVAEVMDATMPHGWEDD